MADDKSKATTPGAAKAQGLKDAAAEASGTKAHAHNAPLNPTDGSKVHRTEDEGEEVEDVIKGKRADVKVSVAAQAQQEQENFVTGFTFDMVQLTELYALMRDGNYWSALKLVVAILNQNLHAVPPTRGVRTGAIVARVQTPVRLSEVDDICEKLQSLNDNFATDQVLHTRTTGSKEAVRASREANVSAVDPIAIINLINMVLGLIGKWRQSRS